MTLEAAAVVAALESLGLTHVVWIPDSVLGSWECALTASRQLTLVRVAREGEAWAIAAGLHLGGQQPLVVIQNTGLFESGDALRNVLFDMRLPLYVVIGYRSFLVANSPDTARYYTEPVLRAWGLPYVILDGPDPLARLAEHYRACQTAGQPGAALVPEGKG